MTILQEEKGRVTSASLLLLNVLGLADRIGCFSVSSLCPWLLTAVTRATLQTTCTEITRQFWGWSVSVLHFAEIVCQTLFGIVAWISESSNLFRLSSCLCLGLLMFFDPVCSLIATLVSSVSCYVLQNQLVIFYSIMQINAKLLWSFMQITAKLLYTFTLGRVKEELTGNGTAFERKYLWVWPQGGVPHSWLHHQEADSRSSEQESGHPERSCADRVWIDINIYVALSWQSIKSRMEISWLSK